MEYKVDKFYEVVSGTGRSKFVYFIQNSEGTCFVLTGEKREIDSIPEEVNNSIGISEELFLKYCK